MDNFDLRKYLAEGRLLKENTNPIWVIDASEDSADTDVKEALVSLFYVSNITTPFTKENYDERVNQLIPIVEKGIPGESSNASDKVATYLKSFFFIASL